MLCAYPNAVQRSFLNAAGKQKFCGVYSMSEKEMSSKKAGGKKTPSRRENKPDRDEYDALLEGEKPVQSKNVVDNKAKAAKPRSTEPSPKTARSTSQKRASAAPRKKKAVSSEPYDELDDAFPRKKQPKRAPRKKTGKNGPDAYDQLLDAASNKTASRKKSRGNSGAGMTVALILCIGAVAALGARQISAYAQFQNMRQVVEQQTFYQGTTVDGIDVSGMTLEDALIYWENHVEPAFENVTVKIEGSASLTSIQLGYTSDYRSVLENAWSAGRSGSLEQRYREITQRQETPARYVVSRKRYSDEMVDQYVAAMADAVNAKASDAHIDSFDTVNYAFVFAEGSAGRELDEEKFRMDLIAALEAGGGTVSPSVQVIQPGVTIADIQDSYGMVASAVTNASSSSSNRLTNIKLALAAINGTRLSPGETFSFNGTVGKRTAERGYKLAGAYNAGEVTEEVGGGICQVSTTLFNAAVKADMEIVERHNHSIPVGYVDKGKDATVDWGAQDLRFTNTSDDDVYICCFLSDDKRVRVGIFGKLLEDGRYITVEAVTTAQLNSETEYRVNSFMAPGTQNVLQQGRTGYTASAYKIVWNADGTQRSKELLCTSRYPARNTIIEKAP